jgi:hypothetical protein
MDYPHHARAAAPDGSGVVRGVTGGTLMQRTGLWTKLLPPA